jgi:hypothetical protein
MGHLTVYLSFSYQSQWTTQAVKVLVENFDAKLPFVYWTYSQDHKHTLYLLHLLQLTVPLQRLEDYWNLVRAPALSGYLHVRTTGSECEVLVSSPLFADFLYYSHRIRNLAELELCDITLYGVTGWLDPLVIILYGTAIYQITYMRPVWGLPYLDFRISTETKLHILQYNIWWIK